MLFEKIESLWAEDSKIDMTDLSNTSIKTYELHAKYFKYLNEVRKQLARLDGRKARILLLKTEHLLGNLDQETMKEMGWKPNPKIIMKTDLSAYINGDQEIIDINVKIADLRQLAEFLDSIIRAVHNRSFVITNIIEDRKFINGGR